MPSGVAGTGHRLGVGTPSSGESEGGLVHTRARVAEEAHRGAREHRWGGHHGFGGGAVPAV